MYRYIYSLLVLISFSGGCLSSSSSTVTVHPGQNITLSCSITATTYTSWYRLSRSELTLIILVKKQANMDLLVDHNADESHFLLGTESLNDSVSLVILAVQQADVGLYYCGAQLRGLVMQFGKPIHLTLPGAERSEAEAGLCWELLISAGCVLALVTTLCISMLLYKLGLHSSFSVNCVKENSNLKAADLQYASLRHATQSPQRAAVPDNHNVTYDVVARKIQTNPRA